MGGNAFHAKMLEEMRPRNFGGVARAGKNVGCLEIKDLSLRGLSFCSLDMAYSNMHAACMAERGCPIFACHCPCGR